MSLQLLLLVTLAAAAPAQERRRSPAGGGGGGPAATSVDPRAPLAGIWQGSFVLNDGRGGDAIPLGIVLTRNASGSGYRGQHVAPDGKHFPIDRIEQRGDTLTWKWPNSGGGHWHYRVVRSEPNRLTGTVILRDWPQGNGAQPSGLVQLTRKVAR